jgi:hypothetical protein
MFSARLKPCPDEFVLACFQLQAENARLRRRPLRKQRLAEQFHEDFIGDVQFCRGKSEDVTLMFYHAMRREATNFVSDVNAILAFEAGQIDAGELAQTKK